MKRTYHDSRCFLDSCNWGRRALVLWRKSGYKKSLCSNTLETDGQLLAEVAIALEDDRATCGCPLFNLNPIGGTSVLLLPKTDGESLGSQDNSQPGDLVVGHNDASWLIETAIRLADQLVSVEVSGGHSCSMRGFFAKIVTGGDLVGAEVVSVLEMGKTWRRVLKRRARRNGKWLAGMEVVAVLSCL